MTVINPDLSVSSGHSFTPPGPLRGCGRIRATYRTLRDRFADPDFGLADPDDGVVWLIDTSAGRIQLFNWLPSGYFLQKPDVEVPWGIQAGTDSVLPWLFKIVHGRTTRFPTAATVDGGSDATPESLTYAYLDYLWGRWAAVDATQAELPWPSPQFADNQHQLNQLYRFAATVQQHLHTVEWANASPAYRHSWATSPRPDRHPGQPDVDYWREHTRWSFAAEGPAPVDNRDLAGLLRSSVPDLADWVANTIEHAEVEEHWDTLRSLAAAAAGHRAEPGGAR